MQTEKEMQKNMEARFAFIDMDDTLLGPDKTISAENLRALDRLRGAGVEIIIASGRHHRVIAGFQDRIPDLDWLVSSHGSAVGSLKTGERLLEMTLAPETVASLLDRAREEDVDAIAYHREGIFIGNTTEWTDLHSWRNAWPLEEQDFQSLARDQFQKILWTGPGDRIGELARSMERACGDAARVLRTEPELLEFYPPGASKARGARALLAGRGLENALTLAFGDSHNDVEILAWADISVAMDHGCEAARKAARFISPAAPPEVAFARGVDLALKHLGGKAGRRTAA